MLKVVGIKHSTGEFNGRPYDNYYLYSVDEEEKNVIGVCPQMVKVKAELINQIVSPDQIQKLLNKKVEFLYDSYKNVALINVK